MSLVSCRCAIQGDRSLRATRAADKYFFYRKIQTKCSSPRQNAIELILRYVNVIG